MIVGTAAIQSSLAPTRDGIFVEIARLLERFRAGDAAITSETVIAEDPSLDTGVGGTVRVGVRPEKISIVPEDEPAASGRIHVTGTVRMASYIGVNYQYRVDGPGGRELTVFVQNQGAAGSHPSVGQRVRLEWLPEHTFVVEPSGESLDQEEDDG